MSTGLIIAAIAIGIALFILGKKYVALQSIFLIARFALLAFAVLVYVKANGGVAGSIDAMWQTVQDLASWLKKDAAPQVDAVAEETARATKKALK